jgi:hypothetical protein
MPSPFGVPIGSELIAELSEEIINNQEFPLLISHWIQFRFSALIHPMMGRNA